MKKMLLNLLFISGIMAFSQFPELVKTPPMVWNFWNAFDLIINLKILKPVADSIGSKNPAVSGNQYTTLNKPFAGSNFIGMAVCVNTSNVFNISELNHV
jgi:hypothetical protein